MTLRSRRKNALQPSGLSMADEEELRSLLDKTEKRS
jgi:hypothetical protein